MVYSIIAVLLLAVSMTLALWPKAAALLPILAALIAAVAGVVWLVGGGSLHEALIPSLLVLGCLLGRAEKEGRHEL